jgi:hypothetical protein
MPQSHTLKQDAVLQNHGETNGSSSILLPLQYKIPFMSLFARQVKKHHAQEGKQTHAERANRLVKKALIQWSRWKSTMFYLIVGCSVRKLMYFKGVQSFNRDTLCDDKGKDATMYSAEESGLYAFGHVMHALLGLSHYQPAYDSCSVMQAI